MPAPMQITYSHIIIIIMENLKCHDKRVRSLRSLNYHTVILIHNFLFYNYMHAYTTMRCPNFQSKFQQIAL